MEVPMTNREYLIPGYEEECKEIYDIMRTPLATRRIEFDKEEFFDFADEKFFELNDWAGIPDFKPEWEAMKNKIATAIDTSIKPMEERLTELFNKIFSGKFIELDGNRYYIFKMSLNHGTLYADCYRIQYGGMKRYDGFGARILRMTDENMFSLDALYIDKLADIKFLDEASILADISEQIKGLNDLLNFGFKKDI